MTVRLFTNNAISIDGQDAGFVDSDGHKHIFYATQEREGTVVYSASPLGGFGYRVHKMPHPRYSLAHEAPASGVPGVNQFEADMRALVQSVSAAL